MGLGKTYSAKYLLDSNNNRGAVGQLLSTTASGIDWVDANTVPGAGLWLESGNNIYNSNSGNVGIGDTTPSFPLVISKSSSETSNGADNSMRLALVNPDQTNNNYALIAFSDGTSDPGSGFFGMQFTDHTNNYGDLCFGTRGASGYGEKMRIESDGKIQIGNNIPMWSGSYGGALFLKGNNATGDRYSQLTEVDSTGAITQVGLVVKAGNVGIGTITPGTLHGASYGTTKLHVDGGTDRGQVIIEGDAFAGVVMSDNGATENERVFATSVDDAKYTIKPLADNGTSTAGGVAVTVLHGGNVGIGTTTPMANTIYNGTYNQGLNIDTGGHSSLLIGDGVNDGGMIQSSDDSQRIIITANVYDQPNASWSRFTADSAALIDVYGEGSAAFISFNVDSGTSGFPTNRMHIKNNGNVGIGTTTPDYRLEVESTTDADLVSIKSTAITNNTQMRLGISGDDSVISGTGGSTGNLVFKTYGSEKMRLTAGARINMDVMAGQASEGVIRIGRYDANTSRYNEIQNSVTSTGEGSYMNLSVHNGTENAVTDVMTLIGSGNVGIGITGPIQKLDTPNIVIGGSTIAGTYRANSLAIDNNGGTSRFYSFGPNTSTNGAYVFHIANSDATTNPEIIRIASDGNVGIGTTDPGISKLMVVGGSNYGTLKITNSETANVNKQTGICTLNYIGNSTSIMQYATNAGANTAYYGSADGGFRGLTQHSFMVSSGADTVSHAETMAISSAKITMSADVTMSGSVGIGETALQRKFNLYDGTDTWTRVQCGASTADWLHGIAGSNHTYLWYNQSSNGGAGNKMGLATSGTLTVSGDLIAYGSPSDKRLKENIKPIESALDKVSKLQGVTFDWIQKEDQILDIKEDIGFIAQDVQKVIPELVRENEDGMLSMRHQGIAPILLEAIKELKAEIEELKKKIK